MYVTRRDAFGSVSTSVRIIQHSIRNEYVAVGETGPGVGLVGGGYSRTTQSCGLSSAQRSTISAAAA